MSKHQQIKEFKKFLNTGLGRFSIIAVVAVILLLVTVVPSLLPHKVSDKERTIAHAVMDLAEAKNKTLAGTVNLQTAGISAAVDIDVAAKSLAESQGSLKVKATIGASTYDIPVEFVYDKNQKVQYYKISHTDSLLDAALDPSAAVGQTIRSVAKKIDGKWLRLTPENMHKATESVTANKCTTQLLERLQSNDEVASESIAEVIASRTFLTISKETSVKDGNEYTIKIDPDRAKEALDVFKQTELFKNASACKESYDPLKLDEAEKNKTLQQQQTQETETIKSVLVLKLTVNKDKQITNVAYNATSQGQVLAADVAVGSNESVAITTPASDIVDYSTVSKDVNTIFKTLTTPPANAAGGATNLVQPYAG